MEPIDIVNPLKSLKETSDKLIASGQASPFVKGYVMGLEHAIELAEVLQHRINLSIKKEKE